MDFEQEKDVWDEEEETEDDELAESGMHVDGGDEEVIPKDDMEE